MPAHQARVDRVREAVGIEDGAHRPRSAQATRCPGSRSASGADSTTPASPGFLLSRMRSGLLCRRRCESSSSVGMLLEVRPALAVRGTLVGLPRLLSSRRTSVRPSSRHSARAIRIISASTSGPAKPSASARRAGGTAGSGRFCGRSWRNIGPDRPEAQRAVVQRVVLDHGAHDARGGLGPQRQLVAVHGAVWKEYISFSTMSVTSPRPRTNSAVGSTMGVSGTGSHSGPAGRARWLRTTATAESGSFRARHGGRQDVVHAFDGIQFISHSSRRSCSQWSCAQAVSRPGCRSASRCSSRRSGGTRWRCSRRAASAPSRRR
jgi:hypothetical protein